LKFLRGLPEGHVPQINKKYDTKHTYLDKSGCVVAHVLRTEAKGKEKKSFYPVTFYDDNGKIRHQFKWFTENAPIYGLNLINDSDTVIIVEGEKCADALNSLDDFDYPASTWQGGSNSNLGKTDFSPLKDKKILLWPDNDEAGINGMKKLAAELIVTYKIARNDIRILSIPGEYPKKWDAADMVSIGVDAQRVLTFIKDNQKKLEEIVAPELPEHDFPEHDVIEALDQNKKKAMHDTQDTHFKILGYQGQSYFYYSNEKQQLVTLSPPNHTTAYLRQLAPLIYWEAIYMDTAEAKLNKAICDDLMGQCHDAGVFDITSRRGIGAWYDEDRVVIHMGTCLSIDGVKTELSEYRGKYFYEQANKTDAYDFSKIATTEESKKIIDLFDALAISNEGHIKLLAGWCVIAPICGILSWRPHVWITGSAGKGKSWTLENIISIMVGKIAIKPEGDSSEAGIRQTLGIDARPVIHDETEADNRKGKEDLQKKLSLARSASSENDSDYLKGSASHEAIAFKIRSCFMFASINVNLNMNADKSRFTVMEFGDKDKTSPEQFDKIKKLVSENLSREQCSALRARTIKLIPTIKHNIEVFASTGVRVFDSQRDADQFAPMLAGYYSLLSDEKIEPEKALDIMSKFSIGENKEEEVKDDGQKCFDLIMQSEIFIQEEAGNAVKNIKISVGELVSFAMQPHVDGVPEYTNGESEKANDQLRKIGIKVESKNILISNSHKRIKDLLQESPWSDNWRVVLKRLNEDEPKSKIVKWPDSTTSRVTQIPLSIITGMEIQHNYDDIPF